MLTRRPWAAAVSPKARQTTIGLDLEVNMVDLLRSGSVHFTAPDAEAIVLKAVIA
jgi:UDP-N-acetyl-D-mannosaminuronate dehydrogenase